MTYYLTDYGRDRLHVVAYLATNALGPSDCVWMIPGAN